MYRTTMYRTTIFKQRTALLLVFSMAVAACSGGNETANSIAEPDPPPVAAPPPPPAPVPTPNPAAGALDATLHNLILEHNLSGDPSIGRELPQISDPLPQLGKKLFFSKSLGGDFDSACVTCHHPMLGGSDGLSLSIGTGALQPNLLGPGRTNALGSPNVPRNAPTTFNTAIWDTALFMDSRVESLGKEVRQNGADCVQCHSGDLFTDGEHHAIGIPQFGPGKNTADRSDFGGEAISGSPFERFRFRTPSLLNVQVTAPYMHTGAYESLQQVLQHYDNPDREVDNFFDDGGWCRLEQFADVQNCEDLYPEARANTRQVLNKIDQERNQNDPAALPNINLDNNERRQIIEFLLTLTDPCILDRACMEPWIPPASEAPDSHQLNAVDAAGLPL